MKIGRWASVIAAAMGVASCGGQVGDKVRPKDFTAQSALGAPAPACTGEPKVAVPLVVDLDSDSRIDLEAAMKRGVVVVAYDCNALRVLSTCKVGDGSYDFARVTKREVVVQLKGEDDLKVNLPLSAGKLGGEIRSGRTIDLGLVSIGRRTTLLASVDRDDLKGGCEGATHFLQKATVGAFSIATGSVGKAAAVADLFKVGASATSESSRTSSSQDGSLEACRAADPESETMPADCHVPISVELTPIRGHAAQVAAAKAVEAAAPAAAAAGGDDHKEQETKRDEENPCRPGYVYANGLCSKPTNDGHLCDPHDHEECDAQCKKGDPGSCYNYGRYAQREKLDAQPFYKKACDGANGDACDALGKLLRPSRERKEANAFKSSFDLFKKSCELGSADGCYSLARAHESGFNDKADPASAFRAYSRSCSLGGSSGCREAALSYADGKGTAKSPEKAIELFAKACAAGNAYVCEDFVRELESGDNIPKDLARAAPIAIKLCEDIVPDPAIPEMAYYAAPKCDEAAFVLAELGRDDEAFAYAKRACTKYDKTASSCSTLAKLQAAGRGTKKDPRAAKAIFKKFCASDSNLALVSLRKDNICAGSGRASPFK